MSKKYEMDILVGCAIGDEGKARVVHYLAKSADIVARWAGGNNAGHTVYVDSKKVVLHSVPTGIVCDNAINFIGSGCVIDPIELFKEVKALNYQGFKTKGRLFLSEGAHVTTAKHKYEDAVGTYNGDVIKSTNRGIGPTYRDKYARTGKTVLMYDKLNDPYFKELKDYLDIVEYGWLRKPSNSGKKILAEGAQGHCLDINNPRFFPFVTSSTTVSSGAFTGLELPPFQPNRVVGVTKLYLTRVGGGNVPWLVDSPLQEEIRTRGNEFGATTGRARTISWVSLDDLKESVEVSGVTDLVITKSDVLLGAEKIGFVMNNEKVFVPGFDEFSSRNFSNILSLFSNYLSIPKDRISISNGPNENDWYICNL